MRIFAVVLAILVLAGCSSAATRTGVEIEQKVDETSFISAKSEVVAISLPEARKVMSEIKSCYDGYTRRVDVPGTMSNGVPMTKGSFVMEFKAEITNEDGRERLVVWKQDHGVLQLTDKTRGFIVMSSTQLEAAGEGTKVTSHHVFQYGFIHDRLVQWMQGDTSKCF
ncbi:hypothetical protein ATL17_1535 [Maritalea mobilis]|uniref:Lipoprotein n=1 Tax=Maritalea mobilis TaxID=483324 RepID=A0A4R6VTX5_9HYPH|nr:hypothetical protein [Maritalea mobilis]TDQ67519.1 hypothetical protein ATL17_1535 [Maritalea mobilis]